MKATSKVLALCGGVGGAKLALGLSKILNPDQLLIVANTGDDFEHLGLPICPDLDTVMYTLAGINNTQQGWGLQDETWSAMGQIRRYGGDSWFNLGDKDIATHLMRKQLLGSGHSLSETTAHLCRQLGVKHQLLPMSDQPVSTQVHTEGGPLPFQHYFVKEQCQPIVTGFDFIGVETAQPQPEMLRWLADDNLTGIILCPSNPFVSIEPMLTIPGVRQALTNSRAPCVAVCPIIGGKAVKGPAAKMMQELAMEVTSLSVAKYYNGLIQGMVIDTEDSEQANAIRGEAVDVKVAPTLMQSLNDRINLAQTVLDYCDALSDSE